MRHAIILHAWYNHPEDHWYPWLKNELVSLGYAVEVPELPTMNTDAPDLAAQLSAVVPLVRHDSVIVGHSLGSLLAMRIAEKRAYETMVLLAGWDFNELTAEHRLFWKKPMNHEAIRKHVRNIYVLSSDNDPYITAITAEDMSKRLGGTFILVKGAGHFTMKHGVAEIPEILGCL